MSKAIALKPWIVIDLWTQMVPKKKKKNPKACVL